jgi:hypothetical protein
MKFVVKIISRFIAALILVQSIQFTLASYFYSQHNDILVAACCKNKNTDPNCNAKCFLEESQEEQNQTDQNTLKKVEYIHTNFNLVIEESISSLPRQSNNTFYYSNLYIFNRNNSLIKPPILG